MSEIMIQKLDERGHHEYIPISQAAKEIAILLDKDMDCQKEYEYQLAENMWIEAKGILYYLSVFRGEV